MEKNKFYFTLLIIVFQLKCGFGQTDTIIEYTLNTHSIEIILPVSYDTDNTFDHTSSSVGSLASYTPLNLVPPTSNLFSNSNFSKLSRVELDYNVTDYPIRTACKIFYFNDGIKTGVCSGTIVGEDFVLTSGHCVFNMSTQTFPYDSILVVPAYNNGIMPPTLSSSFVDKIYIFKTLYNNETFEDIALLRLQHPIGQQTGWIGIAFNSDNSYFNNRVFHKLSYPSDDSSLIYNGDTLYYNYGYINNLSGNNLGIISPEAIGIPGQSGSSLFYTDNSEYYSFAVMKFSSYYSHHQINQRIFYQLQNILQNYSLSIHENSDNDITFNIYPNPSNGVFNITHNQFGQMKLEIVNVLGGIIYKTELTNQETIVDLSEHTKGIYYVLLTDTNSNKINKKVVIR